MMALTKEFVLWFAAVMCVNDYVTGQENTVNSRGSGFTCPNPGDVPAIYPDPSSCVHFYQCEHVGTNFERATRQRCPVGLLFQVDDKVCDWASNVQCEDGVRPTQEPTGSGDGEVVVTPDPTGSESLDDGITSKEAMPGEEEGLIPITTERPPASTDPNATFKCPQETSGEPLYRDPQDCTFYYHCAHVGTTYETAYRHRCPANLVFNEDKKYCDWPRNVPGCENVGQGQNATRKRRRRSVRK